MGRGSDFPAPAVRLRPERAGDEDAIGAVVTAAFQAAKHRGGNEAAIVAALRDAGALTLALVAIAGDEIVGHVAFSPVAIGGKLDGWFGLAPVAVLPSWQGKGVGRALIENGLSRLRARAAAGCVVLGDPACYGRFGFVADPGLVLPGVPAEYFQQLAFDGRPRGGNASYHPAFGAG